MPLTRPHQSPKLSRNLEKAERIRIYGVWNCQTEHTIRILVVVSAKNVANFVSECVIGGGTADVDNRECGLRRYGGLGIQGGGCAASLL
jgi:hypothetical protein